MSSSDSVVVDTNPNNAENDPTDGENPHSTSEETEFEVDFGAISASVGGSKKKTTPKVFFMMSLRALGLVYGDIGTSVLYVFSTLFTSPKPHDIIGGLSLIIWMMLLIACLKYVIFIFRVTHYGEGGTFALLGIIQEVAPKLNNIAKGLICFMACIAGGFIIGDGALTPAISVISAVEGLSLASAGITRPWIVVIATFILLCLFISQSFGTSKIGVVFGPLMLIWFFTIAALGIYNIAQGDQQVWKAFNPWEGVLYLHRGGFTAYLSLGAVFLSVTGVEAMYADIGHLSVGSVTFAWAFIAFPALLLQYIGQASRFLSDPALTTNPFFNTVPNNLFWPVLIIATIASVIASQALITGTFSIIYQAVGLNFFPRVITRHTSKSTIGRVYMPEINYLLMVMSLAIVLGFQTSVRMIAAYGFAVNVVLLMTTFMYACVLRLRWKVNWILVITFVIFFGSLELAILVATGEKIRTGGWIAVLYGLFFASVMLIWHIGQKYQSRSLASHELRSINSRSTLTTVPNSTGIFISSTFGSQRIKTVSSYVYFTSATKVTPEKVILASVVVLPIPFFPDSKRVVILREDEPRRLKHVLLQYGYAERVNIAEVAQKNVELLGLSPDEPFSEKTRFYFSREYGKLEKSNYPKIIQLPLRLLLSAYTLLLRNSCSLQDETVFSWNQSLDIGIFVNL